MTFILKGYTLGYRIVSLALTEEVRDNLLSSGLETMFVGKSTIILYPSGDILTEEANIIERASQFNNFDVLAIWGNGLVTRLYDDKSVDNFFFITGRCNSNCIMCPSPETSRRNAPVAELAELLQIAKHIPQDTPHLTITGGEPFLMGRRIFPFLNFLRGRFTDTEFLVLTNGRIFSVEEYADLFYENMPQNTVVAIPIHGSNAAIHDNITQAKGSFIQTKQGLHNLLKRGIRIEIRIVVSKKNIDDFDAIADLIIKHFKGIEYISVIAMEMTGNAKKNANELWIPYRQAFSMISSSITKLIKNGINIKLYNYPICTVEKPFRTLCEKSISPNKVRFGKICEQCIYKTACGGIFAGTFQFEEKEIEAIL